jgi:hypothetical protein
MCRDDLALEEDQANQNRDRHPRNRVPDDDSVSEPTVRQQPVVSHQRTTMQTFCIMGASGMFREAGGSLIVTASVFIRVAHRPLRAIVRRLRRIAWLLMNNLASRQRRDGDLLPHIDAAFVQLCTGIRQWILFRDFSLCIAASNNAQLINQAGRD